MTNPLPDQIIYSDAAKIAQLLSGSGTVDPTHPPPTATFPANPAMAPSPSPTGSSITQLKAVTLRVATSQLGTWA